jgi:hypothetical protein
MANSNLFAHGAYSGNLVFEIFDFSLQPLFVVLEFPNLCLFLIWNDYKVSNKDKRYIY